MTIDFTTIEDALWEWVSGQTELETIWDKPNAPRPCTPFAMISHLSGPVKIGTVDDLRHNSGDVFEVCGQRTLSYSISVIGKGAVGYVSDLQISLECPTVLSRLRAAGIAVWEQGEVQDTSTLLETGYEERANMDVVLGVAALKEDEVGELRSTEIDGELTSDTGTQHDVTVEVNT